MAPNQFDAGVRIPTAEQVAEVDQMIGTARSQLTNSALERDQIPCTSAMNPQRVTLKHG